MQRGHRLSRGACYMASQERNHARRECRRDGPSLEFPVVALAEQQTRTHEGTQNANRGRRTPVIARVLDQNVVNGFRQIQQDLSAAEIFLD